MQRRPCGSRSGALKDEHSVHSITDSHDRSHYPQPICQAHKTRWGQGINSQELMDTVSFIDYWNMFYKKILLPCFFKMSCLIQMLLDVSLHLIVTNSVMCSGTLLDVQWRLT